MGRFSWLGGKDDAKADAESRERAKAHRRSATKADRAGWAWWDSKTTRRR